VRQAGADRHRLHPADDLGQGKREPGHRDLRDEYYKPDTQDKGIAEVIVGKHRNGPTGTVKLTFLGEYTKFQNFASPGSY